MGFSVLSTRNGLCQTRAIGSRDGTRIADHLRYLPLPPNPRNINMSKKDTFRVVARGSDGSLQIRDYLSIAPLTDRHEQVGSDDCSTDLELRGMPIFRGLIGPMPEGKNIVRYETPEVFEMLTKEWGIVTPKKRRRRTRAAEQDTAAEAEAIA